MYSYVVSRHKNQLLYCVCEHVFDPKEYPYATIAPLLPRFEFLQPKIRI